MSWQRGHGIELPLPLSFTLSEKIFSCWKTLLKIQNCNFLRPFLTDDAAGHETLEEMDGSQNFIATVNLNKPVGDVARDL